jgi:hypothetical protein
MHDLMETDYDNALRGRFARSVREAKIGLIGSTIANMTAALAAGSGVAYP